MKYSFLVVLCLISRCAGDWGLKDMGRSYFEDAKKGVVVDSMDVKYYAPMQKNILCTQEHTNVLKSCRKEQKLNILVVDQLPVMATQLGCGKRMFHMLEAFVGIGHSVSLAYLRPDKIETDTGSISQVFIILFPSTIFIILPFEMQTNHC